LEFDVAYFIWKKLGAIFTPATGWAVDCNLRCTKYNEYFTFQFGDKSGPMIHVPVAGFIVGPIDAQNSMPLPFQNTCLVGVSSTEDSSGVHILGANVLQSAYVVYDLTHNEIAIAPANLGSKTEKVVQVLEEWKGIPHLSGAATGVTRPSLDPTCTPAPSTGM